MLDGRRQNREARTYCLLTVRISFRNINVLGLLRLGDHLSLLRASVGIDFLRFRVILIISCRIIDIKFVGGIRGIIVQNSCSRQTRLLGIVGIRKGVVLVQVRVRVRWL